MANAAAFILYKEAMKIIFIVEYQHKHGSDFWAANSLEVAEEIIQKAQKDIFKEYNDEGWTLENAMKNWFEFSGHSEAFMIHEVSLIKTKNEARKIIV